MADGIVITGPTATGKTRLAIAVAKRLHGEIVSFDSRQVYRGMDIGTAKPSRAQQSEVPHYGIDVLPPNDRYNAGRFAADARGWISEIRARGHLPILVGGTGFFLRALTNPMFGEPPLDAARKERLKQYLAKVSREELLRWLAVLDDGNARRLAAEGGHQRVSRAVEVALLTGSPLSAWHRQQEPAAPMSFLTFVLELPRAAINARINQRVDDMVAAGLVEEVKQLVAAGYDEGSPGMNATGYIELLPFLRGRTSLGEALDQIKRATRSYARRQQTWFRHQLPPNAVVLDATQATDMLVSRIVQAWQHD